MYVSVFDGDTHAKVKGAVVQIAARKDAVSRRGIAKLRIRRARPLPVTAWAPHYPKRTIRLAFNKRKWRTLYLYRPSLQWPMYGVDPARTQVQASIKIRPPFRIAWSRGMGSLIEFPAVVSDGVAFIGNARGHVRAVSMKTGRVAWRTDTGDRMAASPAIVGDEVVVHTMSTGHVFVLEPLQRQDPPPLHGRVADRVLARRAERDRLLRRVERRRSMRSTCAAAGRSGGTRPATRSPRAPSLYGGKVFIGDYGGRLLALNAASGSLRWSGSVNGRIYGTPAVAAGASSSPPRAGAR